MMLHAVFDFFRESWPVAAFALIMSGIKIFADHLLPADSKVSVVIHKIIDALSMNVKH